MRLGKFKYRLTAWATALTVLLITVTTEVFSIALQPGAFSKSFCDIVSRGATIPLNLFPVLAFVALGYFVTNNVFWGASVPSFVVLMLSYINLLKIEGRDDAFVPSDLGLFREGLASANNYDLNLHIPMLFLIILYCALLVAVGFFVKSASLRPMGRGIAGATVIGTFVLSMIFVYPRKDLYNSFRVPQMYNIPSVFNTLGFNYCFLYNFNLYPIEKPEGYAAAEVKEWETQFLGDKSVSERPNIIMVMGEAFSDISNDSVFAWESDVQNPAYLYNKLATSERAIAGHLVVSNIAAGTANTEFDILTGTPTTMISNTATSSFRVVHKRIPTVASLLASEGYKTSFLHPGNSWFYNRSSVYRYFGIEDQVFNEAFTEDDKIAGLVSDQAFLRELKKKIRENPSPQFIYSVTIQNHQTYNYAKYEDETPAVPLKREVSDATMESVSVYMRGVSDTAQMIYQLAEYLDTIDEPTMLVFFGDHLPNLGDTAYRELGLPIGSNDTIKNIISAYATPFMIYGNAAYCQTKEMKEVENQLDFPDNHLINNIYLGAAVLEMTGFSGRDAYFDYLNQARRELPVFRVSESAYMRKDGVFIDELREETHLEIIKKIDWWQYNRLK